MSELESVECIFLQNWKVSESESVRIGKCQNQKVSELESVRIGKCRIRKCQSWKVADSVFNTKHSWKIVSATFQHSDIIINLCRPLYIPPTSEKYQCWPLSSHFKHCVVHFQTLSFSHFPPLDVGQIKCSRPFFFQR